MGRLFTNFAEDYAQEDADFMTDQPVTDISGLEDAYGLTMEEVKTFDYTVSENTVLRIFSENSKVNIPAVIEGSSLENNEILLDPAYAKANGINIGDSVKILVKTFQVAGTMSLPNYIYPLKSDSDIMSDPKTFGIAVITKEDFDSLGQGNIYYQVRFQDRNYLEYQIAAFKAAINDGGINIIKWENTSVNPRVTYVTTKMKGINKVSTVMPMAMLILTCILTGIIMWRMVKREGAIIGTLYALGYRKKEIRSHYMRYPVVIAVLGGVVGTVLGSLLLQPMLKFMVTYFNMPIDRIIFGPQYLFISILLPLIFLSVASYLVVGKALKNSPLALMKGGDDETKVSYLERRMKLEHFRFPTKFKIREQLRSVARSSFLLFGVVLATMLLMMGFASKSSLDNLIKEGFEEAYQYNYSYVFNTMQSTPPANGEAFSELPFALSSNEDISITIYGVDPESQFVSFKDRSGEAVTANQVIITSALADKIGISEGDKITVTDKLNSKQYPLTIDKVADSYIGNYIYMPLDELNKMVDYPAGSYMGIWSNEKLNIPENSLLTTVTKEEIRNAFNSILAPIQSVVGVTAFLSFLIGLVVIYVVISMIIEENKENISLMKILGYRKKEVYAMILNSSSFTVILGYMIGVPVLLISLKALYQSLTSELSFSMPVMINYGFLIIGFLIIYITYEISKALSKRKVSRISMNEVLKSRLE
jgi:putative ABC transport system permease protein